MTVPQFQGKAVIVTGGGTGIGRATARAFAEQGAGVLVVGRTPDRLAETGAGLPGVRALAADITATGAADLVVDTAMAAFGRIDVLVNNAAVVRQAPLGKVSAAVAEEMVATNLLAPVYLTQAALPHLNASAGVVVNVSTAVGQRGWPMPGGTLYAATKAALDTLTRSWAVQLAPRGVRVVAVAPGPVSTPIAQHQGLTPHEISSLQETLVGHVPFHAGGRPAPPGRAGRADHRPRTRPRPPRRPAGGGRRRLSSAAGTA